MFGIGQKTAKARAKSATLHSIAGMMRGRKFEGNLDAANRRYLYSYSPSKGSLIGGKLQLIGTLTVKEDRPGAGASPKSARNVRATLIASQGGIGAAPPRKKLPPDVMAPRPDLPIVESTGQLSFTGVLYLKLAPLDGRALGVPADMTRLQLNVRLAPVNDSERALQAVFSTIVDSLYGKPVDQGAAVAAIGELNKLLGEA